MKQLLAHPLAPDLVLVFATALWGLAFLIVRVGVEDAPPVAFVAIRFATAALVVGGLSGVRLGRVTPTELRAGALIAAAMVCGYTLQSFGLRTLGAGHVAFISALYVPIVPVLQFLLLRRVLGVRLWVSVVLATGGLMLMAGGPGGAPSRGDFLALGSAFGVAAELMLLAHFAPRVEPRRLAVVECIGVSVYALGIAVATGQGVPHLAAGWLACALGLGAASAFLQISSNWCLRRVPVHRAMLIFATEPVWAGLFGALAGERMGTTALAGAGCILIALLINATTVR